MGLLTPDPRRDEALPGGGSGLYVDLDEKACPMCRRELLPWQETCPEDGAAAVAKTALPSATPPPPAHLLDDDDPAEDGTDQV